MTRRVLRTHIAAQRLGVCVETLKRWLKEGRLQGFKTAGGHWRIPEQEIIDRQANKPQQITIPPRKI